MEQSLYFKAVIDKFLETDRQIKSMESDFKPEMIEKYGEAKKLYIHYAAELIKLGAYFQEFNDTINLKIHNIIFSIKKEKLKEALGSDYSILFKEKESDTSENVRSEIKDTYKTSGKDIKKDEIEKNTIQNYPENRKSNDTFKYRDKEKPHENERYENSSGVSEDTHNNPCNMNTQPLQNQMIPAWNTWGDNQQLMMNSFFAGMMQCMMPFMAGMFENGHPNNAPVQKDEKINTSGVLKDVNEIQKHIILIEQERDDAIKNATQLKKRYEDLRKSLKTQDEQFNETKKRILEEKRALFTEKEQLLKKNEENARIKKEDDGKLANLKTDLEKYRNLAKTFEDKIVNLKQEILDNEKKANDKLRDTKNLCESLQTEKRNLSNNFAEERKKMQEQIDSLKKKAEHDRKEAENEIGRLKDELESSVNRETIANLEYYAFHDSKTGVMNQNAFNENFPKMEKNKIILAMIGIRDMKSVNTTYGRAAGDNIIQMVADKLKSVFSDTNIFRILGDQFIVALDNMDIMFVKENLLNMQKELLEDSINISFGISFGKECLDYTDIINKAEQMMNRSKCEPVRFESVSEPQVTSSVEKTQKIDGVEEVSIEEEIMKFMNN